LSVGRDKLRRGFLNGRVALVRGDAMRLPVADASMDAVTIAFGIRNVEDPLAACRDMHRALRPGGRIALLEFAVATLPVLGPLYRWYIGRMLPRIGHALSRHHDAYAYLPASIDAFRSPDELMKTLRQAGFVEVETVRLTLGSVCLYTGARGER